MNEWFQTCTPEQADAMSARQLDYRFQQDNLGSVWWLAFQQLGFQHNGSKYTLSKSSPSSLHNREYDGKEIYQHLDQLAIPRPSSALQDFHADTKQQQSRQQHDGQVLTKEEREWWRDTRDELIFRKFRAKIEATVDEGRTKPQRNGCRGMTKKSRARTRQKNSVSSDPGAELFLHKHSKKFKHSNNLPQMSDKISFPTVQEYAEMVRSNLNFESVHTLEESYKESFKEWHFACCSLNHSLLFYGVGSKRVLLNSFADEVLEKDGDVLTLEGFDKDVTIEAILDLLVNHWLGGQEPTTHPYGVFFVGGGGVGVGVGVGVGGQEEEEEHGSQVYPSTLTAQRAMAIAKALARQVENTLRPIYLVLHNIDGVGLRNPTAQETLSVLVHCSRVTMCSRKLNAVRLVASVDHVNGPAMLWDSLTCQRFRWVWKHVPTHRPYVEEVTQSTAEEVLRRKAQRKRRVQIESAEDTGDVFDVLTSLAPRHTESLQMLAQLQLAAQQQRASTSTDANANAAITWVDYVDLLRKCQLECIITGDHQLRLFLKEFVDHEIVERKDETGQSLRIPYSVDTLIQIMNFEHEEMLHQS
jgi:hypothetical protein